MLKLNYQNAPSLIFVFVSKVLCFGNVHYSVFGIKAQLHCHVRRNILLNFVQREPADLQEGTCPQIRQRMECGCHVDDKVDSLAVQEQEFLIVR